MDVAARPCDFCGTPITDEMLARGQAREIMKEYFCLPCIEKNNLNEEEEEAAPAPKAPAARPSSSGRPATSVRPASGVRPSPGTSRTRAPTGPARQGPSGRAPAARSTPVNSPAARSTPVNSPAARSTPLNSRAVRRGSGPARAGSPGQGVRPQSGGVRVPPPQAQPEEDDNVPDQGSGTTFATSSARRRSSGTVSMPAGAPAPRSARNTGRGRPTSQGRIPAAEPPRSGLLYAGVGGGVVLLGVLGYLIFGGKDRSEPPAKGGKSSITETTPSGGTEHKTSASAAKTTAGPPADPAPAPPAKLLRPAATAAPASERLGLLGRYYANRKFDGEPALVQRDPNIEFDWKLDRPADELPTNEFGIEWTGLLKAPATGLYTLGVKADEGARVWIGGELAIEAWDSGTAGTIHEGKAELEKDKLYALKVRCHDDTGAANCTLYWTPPGGAREVLPGAQLQLGTDGLNVLKEPVAPAADLLPQPSDDELAVLLMSDDDLDAEMREQRRTWRLERGKAAAGGTEILLGTFENGIEITNWSFRPRKDVLAWLGKQGVTEGGNALRLSFEPRSMAYPASDFYLSLGADQKWDWTGALQVRLDCFNADPAQPLELAVVLRSGDIGTDTSGKRAEFPFSVAPKSAQSLVCDLAGKEIDLSEVRWIGVRVNRKDNRATVLYLDGLRVLGAFKGE
ncbi:MAG: hypothetical protein AMXMBFR7_38780 [Planctomycetota bacterium]